MTYNMDNWKITEHPPAEIVYPPFPHPDCWEFLGIPTDRVRQIREAVAGLVARGYTVARLNGSPLTKEEMEEKT